MSHVASSPSRGGARPLGPSPGSAPKAPPHHVTPPAVVAHPRIAVARLAGHLVLRSTALLAVATGAYVGLEIASFHTAYPQGVSAEQFLLFQDNPAVRMMQGVPTALNTAGGFTMWDAGWIIQLLLAAWAILATTRLLRGEEDVERTDLLLAGPLRATHATGVVLGVLLAAILVIGAAVSTTMSVMDGDASAAALTGICVAGVTATFMATAAVASQLVDVRRRAASLAAMVVAAAYVIRIVGSSSDSRLWLRWLSPLGWLDVLAPYSDADLRVLVPVVLTPLALMGLAILLRRRRDTGGAVFAVRASRRSRLRGLGSPLAFAWRSNRGVLLAWALGLAAYSMVTGALIVTMIDWLAGDQSYQRLMSELGFDLALTTPGFLAMMASVMAVAVAMQVGWRLGATWAEEESGRADAMLSRAVSRIRWLAGHAGLALAGGAALLVVVAVCIWLGVVASGSDQVSLGDSFKAVLNFLPVIVLVCGVAVASYGLVPRLTVPASVSFAVISYLLTVLGAALKWPDWVLDLSPFTHVALVPAQPWAATSGIVMTVLGLSLAVLGLLAFRRRDLVNA